MSEKGILPEAPASATVRVKSPSGFEWLLTSRDMTVNGLLTKMSAVEQYLLKHGWQPANANGRPAEITPDGVAPVCQYHGPMKTSRHGGWFCPAKMGDGTYCREKIK